MPFLTNVFHKRAAPRVTFGRALFLREPDPLYQCCLHGKFSRNNYNVVPPSEICRVARAFRSWNAFASISGLVRAYKATGARQEYQRAEYVHRLDLIFDLRILITPEPGTSSFFRTPGRLSEAVSASRRIINRGPNRISLAQAITSACCREDCIRYSRYTAMAISVFAGFKIPFPRLRDVLVVYVLCERGQVGYQVSP